MKYLLALSTLLLSLNAYAETYVQLILDASGSMYNKVDDGRYRITAAKDVLKDFISGLPNQDLNVGLRIYGSELTRKDDGSCLDSKLYVPMEGVNRTALLNTIRETRARGSTPIAYSLRQAAKDFPTSVSQCAIILVTDGEEVCGGDISAAAQELEDLGCDVDLRIIGFDLTTAAIASFEGIGTFENATDAKQLAEALDRAVIDVVEKDPLGDAVLDAPDEVAAGSKFQVSWQAEAGERDYITIVPADSPDGTYASYAYVDSGNPVDIYAPATLGEHEVRYQSDRVPGVSARRSISVVEAEIALEAPTEIEAGQPFEVKWLGPNGDRDYVTIVAADAQDGAYKSYQYTRNGSPMRLHASINSGPHEIRYQSDRTPGVFARRPVFVRPAEIVIDAPDNIRGGSPFEVQWQGPNGDRDYLTIVTANAPDGQYTSYDYTRNGSPVKLHAPVEAGSYEVRYQSDREGGVFARLVVQVEPANVTLSAPEAVDAGTTFDVTWDGPNGDRDYITIVASGSPAGAYTSYQYTRVGPTVSIQAPNQAGEYEVRYQSDRNKSIYASKKITVN